MPVDFLDNLFQHFSKLRKGETGHLPGWTTRRAVGFYANYEINSLSRNNNQIHTKTTTCLTEADSALSISMSLSVAIIPVPTAEIGGSIGVNFPEFSFSPQRLSEKLLQRQIFPHSGCREVKSGTVAHTDQQKRWSRAR